jgi:hypothetical protein
MPLESIFVSFHVSLCGGSHLLLTISRFRREYRQIFKTRAGNIGYETKQRPLAYECSVNAS